MSMIILLIKRDSFDELMELNHRYAQKQRLKRHKCDTADSKFDQKSRTADNGLVISVIEYCMIVSTVSSTSTDSPSRVSAPFKIHFY